MQGTTSSVIYVGAFYIISFGRMRVEKSSVTYIFINFIMNMQWNSHLGAQSS